MRKIEVLIAVASEPLLRIIHHLLDLPEFQVVESLTEWPSLAQSVHRLHPTLIIVNAKLLGHGAAKIISDIKLASPHSKLIVVSFPYDIGSTARQWGADAYLSEEHLVQRLVPTAQKLVRQRSTRLQKSHRASGAIAPKRAPKTKRWRQNLSLFWKGERNASLSY